MKGSQNGFDNSGLSNRTEWIDEDHFEHWNHAWGEWMGPLNDDGCTLEYANFDNIQHAVKNVDNILNAWGKHPAVAAIEPLNEPWWCSDIPLLKGFYR